MKELIQKIKNCELCKADLPHGVNPIFSAHMQSKIAIIGQAPGKIVHQTRIPWDDKSGERLREWLQVDKTLFYNHKNFALIPMGFCYPGKGTSGDLPPRKECAPQWHNPLLTKMKNLKLTILIGSYAQAYYLKGNEERTLTETVRNFEAYLPDYFVLPHPSPRNNIWLKQNPWFETALLPVLKKKVAQLITD